MTTTCKRNNGRLRIGFAMGGGGARGLAHIGALKVLEAAGIAPEFVVGTSMGSIIGALYCHYQNAVMTEEQVLDQLQDPKMDELGLAKFQKKEEETPALFKRNLNRTMEQLSRIYLLTSVLSKDHIIAEEKVKVMLSLLLPAGDIEDLPIPFGAVAADLMLGKAYFFREGPISTATQASSAIPGIFPPVSYDGMQLVDGAIVSLVPVLETRTIGANFVIAIDVSPLPALSEPLRTGVEIWMRSDQITCKTLRNMHLREADAIIDMPDLNYEWHAFNDAEAIIRAGEKAAEAVLPDILATLRKRLPRWRRWFTSRYRPE